MSGNDKKYIQLRIIITGILFSILYITICSKAVYLQVFQRPWLLQKAEKQYEKSYTTNGKRGTIFDRNHMEMAISIDATSIAAYPKHVADEQQTAKTLAAVLDLDHTVLDSRLASNRSFVWIKRHAIPKEVQAVTSLKLAGIDYISEPSRVYPNRMLAAQAIGFSGIDGHGLEGLEFYYDAFLRGSVAEQTVLKDALGRQFNTDQITDDNSGGNNLVLTIDRTIQYITENALAESAENFTAKSGIAIVMEPSTGAILALAHYPCFNPNSFGEFNRQTWRNRAITDPFEPGSTMKIFLAAAAIESGQCSPNTIFYCENGKYSIGKNTINDTHPREWLSLQQIIKYSSNIGAVKVTQKMGKQTLYDTLRAFGFGQKTGVDCPGETSGSLASPSHWSKIDTAAISFGQGLSVSAIQLISATAAIANDGIVMKPYIVQAITDKNGRMIKQFEPSISGTAVSAKTAQSVKKIMKTVTSEDGTGAGAALKDYAVCGKTGTAQKITKKGEYAEDKFVASFVGFAPANNPEIAVLIIIDEPEKAYYGGTVAAPAFKKIALETLNYLHIPDHKDGIKKPNAPARKPKERLTVSIDKEVNA